MSDNAKIMFLFGNSFFAGINFMLIIDSFMWGFNGFSALLGFISAIIGVFACLVGLRIIKINKNVSTSTTELPNDRTN